MNIETINFDRILKLSKNNEGIVVLGAGGKPEDWITGISEMLFKEEIAKSKNIADLWKDNFFLTITTGGRRDLLLQFKEGKNNNLSVGRLAMWRLRFGECSWLSDYVVNYAKHHMIEAE